jgi:hypothetical protein
LQPPPPGSTTRSVFDAQRAPPPPPSVASHALSVFKRETIVPMTEAVCSGAAAEGHAHRELCNALVNKLGTFEFIYGVGMRAVLCSSMCFHSCEGNHVGGQDHDSFDHCKQPACANTPCLDFFLAECPPVMHEAINKRYEGVCTLAAPSPPSPPAPPPAPPLPPRPLPLSPPPRFGTGQ